MSFNRSHEVADFLRMTAPARGYGNVVAINPMGKECFGKSYTADSIDQAAAFVDRYQRQKYNLYWAPNPINNDIDKKPLKSDIRAMRWVHLDMDDPSEEALAAIRNYKHPPTLIVFSGGGYNAYWLLDKPRKANGNIAKLEAANRQVILDLHADPGTHNLDRILRLPGTINYPTEAKLARGRTPVKARLIEYHPERRYTLDQFVSKNQREIGARAESNPVQRAADPVLLRSALAHIPNDKMKYNEWINVGQAVKGALGEDGLQDFLDWSEKSKNNKGDRDGAAKKWKSFKPDRIGAGTIFYLAQEAGWVRPAESKAPPSKDVFDLSEHFEPVSKMLKRDIAPVSYLLDGLLARGATSILGGPPKGLKSTLALYFSLILVGAIKSDWEKFKAVDDTPRRVGYLDLEQADPLFKERLEQFDPDKVRGLYRINKFPVFDADGVATLERMIVDKRLELVVVDTVARIRDPNSRGNASEIDAALLDPITKMAHSTGCHIQLVAQNGKRKDKDNPLEMLAATNQLAAAVDDVLILFKPENAEHELRRNLFVTGRHIRSPGTYLIDRTDTDFQFLGEAATALQGQLQKDVLAVLRGMHGMQGPLSPSDIGGVLGKQRIAVQKVLAKLVDRQLVATAGGKYSSLENAIKRLKR